MNKAFTKDPEAVAPTCPGCGTAGSPVERETVMAQVGGERAAIFASEVFFCWNPACATGYFDAWSAAVAVAELASPAYPKVPHAPVCPCLGVTADAIAAEAQAGRRDTVLRIIEHIRGRSAGCAGKSPDGQPCERRVRRLHMDNAPR